MNVNDARERLMAAIGEWGAYPLPNQEKWSVVESALEDLEAAIYTGTDMANQVSAMTEKIAAMESLSWTAGQRDELKRLLRRMSQELSVIERGIQRSEYRKAAADAILNVTIEILHGMVRGWLLLVSEKGKE